VKEDDDTSQRRFKSVIHFDTNFLIQAYVPGTPASGKFQSWGMAGETLSISTIAWAEFLCGPLDARADTLARNVFPRPEPFLPEDAELAAKLFNQTGRRSRSLADCMIAAVAIRSGAKLATLNAADFQPLINHGLAIA
jgi:predicted nucleic acid-binding protein